MGCLLYIAFLGIAYAAGGLIGIMLGIVISLLILILAEVAS